ncbi:MAG: carboxypeptidase-like regulatory domain-containing protein [Marinilabiliales bacterium]|nr:carboxypeptidase-like regulatory domain-containing protein [Marinilabiliales bacterium]
MVVEKGTLNATSTDANGGFVINVAGEQSVLVISFIGLKTVEVVAGNGSAQLEISSIRITLTLKKLS